MIIRRLGSTDLLIPQPEHAALAARIMRQWHSDHFPDSPRKASILRAVEEHDSGWLEVDETLVVDEATGRLVTLKGQVSGSGLPPVCTAQGAGAKN